METIWEIIGKPAWYWFITIIPALLTYIGVVPENKRGLYMNQLFEILPAWIWLTLSYIAFITTILISVNKYLKRKKDENDNELNDYKKEIERLNTEKNNMSIQSENQSGGVSGKIQNSQIHQGDNYYSSSDKEIVQPNIEIKNKRVRKRRIGLYLRNGSGREVQVGHPVDAIVAEVEFINNPEIRRKESTSFGVRAEITYNINNTSNTVRTNGKWVNAENIDIAKSTDNVDLLYNSEPRILLIAFKYLEDAFLYMYGKEVDSDYLSIRHQDLTYRMSNEILNDVNIKVRLIGENLDKTFDLTLRCGGRDAEIEFIEEIHE